MRRQLLLVGALLPLAWMLAACKDGAASTDTTEVTLAAAASLRRVLPALIEAYQQKHPETKLRVAYGASGDLRKRVVDGAPIDAVLLASAKPVEELIASGHVDAASRKVVARNELVLIAPSRSTTSLTFETLDELPAGDKLAIGEPSAVPAGQYALQALRNLGKWKSLEGRLVYGGDVSAVLAYARRGEVAAAIVYGTEILGIDGVKLLDRARGDWAPAPEVVVGWVKDAPHAAGAAAFLEFVSSEEGKKILVEHGFGEP